MSQSIAGVVASYVGGSPMNVARTCRGLGISRKTFYKYVKRFRADGVEGFFPDSRRPNSSPGRLDARWADVLVALRKDEESAGLDYGADALLMRLEEQPDLWPLGSSLPSRSMVNRALDSRGFLVKVPQRKPKPKYRRFERQRPNELWQLDGFEYPLASGSKAVVLHISDDCSRVDLALRAATSENAADTWLAFCDAANNYGLPAALLTDNGTSFSGKRRGWSSDLERKAFALGIETIASRPHHPQTCGKNERAHQRVKKWLNRRPKVADLEELQVLLDQYRRAYNDRRNMVLDKLTPDQRFALGPMAYPQRGLQAITHVTTAHVTTAGGIGIDGHIAGIGKRYIGKTATVFRTGDLATVFIDDQMVREFIIDRTKDYQPKKPIVLPKS